MGRLKQWFADPAPEIQRRTGPPLVLREEVEDDAIYLPPGYVPPRPADPTPRRRGDPGRWLRAEG